MQLCRQFCHAPSPRSVAISLFINSLAQVGSSSATPIDGRFLGLRCPLQEPKSPKLGKEGLGLGVMCSALLSSAPPCQKALGSVTQRLHPEDPFPDNPHPLNIEGGGHSTPLNIKILRGVECPKPLVLQCFFVRLPPLISGVKVHPLH